MSKQLAQAAVAEYTGSVLAPERELKEHGMMVSRARRPGGGGGSGRGPPGDQVRQPK